MTHIHYKFSSKRSYNTVVFDGVNITLCELKRLIMTREKLRAADCDLQITNGQTKEEHLMKLPKLLLGSYMIPEQHKEYTDAECHIPKGTSVIVRRVPSRAGKSSSSANSSVRSEAHNYNSGFFKPPKDGPKSAGVLPIFSQMADLANAEVSEDDKIKTIMNQSGYDSSNYQKYGGPLPANYTCYRCGSSEHHIRNCPVTMDKNTETVVRIKKSTGIPRSFMVRVDDPSIKGAMLTNTGDYAVPAIDAEAYAVGKKKIPAQEQQTEDSTDTTIPDELQCLICRDLLSDAVVIPCCGNSYCDDCIRSALLDSEDHVCPTCSQTDVSPDTLIANKFLRQAVNNFTREQSCTQSFKSTPNTSRSQDCTPRPSPAPTPPPQSQPEKSQETDKCTVVSSDSPPSSFSTPLNVVKHNDETPVKEADTKKTISPAESPSVLVSDADICDSGSQPIVVNSVSQAVADDSKPDPKDLTTQCGQASHWDRSVSGSVSEGWTTISSHPPAFTLPTFSLPPSPIITPSHFPTYLQQPPLSTYAPGFCNTTPSWTSVPSPQGAPIPAFTSSPTPTIPPLLPKELMLYHRRNQERTPPRGSLYNTSCHFSSKSHRSKSSRSSSRSPSRSRSHDKTRHYSPYSSHRSLSSRSYSYKRSHSPTTASSPSSHSQHRSRSPADGHKGRHHGHHHNRSSSRSSRRRKEREVSEQSYDTYLRWKQEYTDWCEKYFNSYFSHFHQMPPPPLMPPPQPHWPSHPPYPHRGPSPPSTDSRSSKSLSYSERSSTTTRSSSSYSDSTPTQSFSDSNSPHSDDCSGASHKQGEVSENQHKKSGKQRIESRTKSPPKKTDKHKSKVQDEKAKDLKPSDKNKERQWREEKGEKRHKKASEKTARSDADRGRHPRRSTSPDVRSDKSKKRRDEETPKNQRQNIPIEPPPDSDLFPKALERERPKKAVWKPLPLTKENAWEGGVKVKPQKKINININLNDKKDDKRDIEEANNTMQVEGHAMSNQFYNQVEVNKAVEMITPEEGIKDVKNDSWEIFPDDETERGEDSDLWQCALTAMEEEDGQAEEVEKSVEIKHQGQQDIFNRKGPSMIIDNSFTVGQSGRVTVCEELQKAVEKISEETIEKQSLEKHSDNVKVPHSRRERDASDKEQHNSVSSHLREVKAKAKRRLVGADYAEEIQVEDNVRLDGTVAPSSGRDMTDSNFDFDRKGKKREESERESRTGEEGRRHKERDGCSTLNKKSSKGSSQVFTAILDADKYSSHREPDESRNREGKFRKINMELDIEWKGKHAYSKHYYHDGNQDKNWSTSPSQSDSRDRGQVSSKTSSEGNHHGQNLTCTSLDTALDPGGRRERREEKDHDSKNEHKKDRKKQKSHKKEKRTASPDEAKKSKKRDKDGRHMDLSKEYFSDKYT